MFMLLELEKVHKLCTHPVPDFNDDKYTFKEKITD